MDAPDTDRSSIITDHHFVPHDTELWRPCQYPGCGLALAAHAKGAIEDTDPGRPASMRRSAIIATQGHKDDDGKAPFFYLPWEALEEVAFVMQYGARKYAPGNYRKGMKSSRLFSACVRHIVDWWKGEQKDPETGRPHLAHAVCCLLMLIESELIETVEDDRYAHASRTHPANPGPS